MTLHESMSECCCCLPVVFWGIFFIVLMLTTTTFQISNKRIHQSCIVDYKPGCMAVANRWLRCLGNHYIPDCSRCNHCNHYILDCNRCNIGCICCYSRCNHHSYCIGRSCCTGHSCCIGCSIHFHIQDSHSYCSCCMHPNKYLSSQDSRNCSMGDCTCIRHFHRLCWNLLDCCIQRILD